MSKPFLREIGSALFASIHLFVEAIQSVGNLFLISLCWARNILYEPAGEPAIQKRREHRAEFGSPQKKNSDFHINEKTTVRSRFALRLLFEKFKMSC